MPALPLGLVLRRVSKPSDEEREAILQAMIKGFRDEPFTNHFPAPTSVESDELHRAENMARLGPALIEGEVWIVIREEEEGEEVLGVGIWSLPGHILGDPPESKQYKEAHRRLLSREQVEWQAVKSTVTAERDALFPSLWRDTFHLHILVTVPEARGKGAGGALVREMVRQAEAVGKDMSLSTPTEPNRRFYQGQGFTTLWEREMVYPSGWREPYIVMVRKAAL